MIVTSLYLCISEIHLILLQHLPADHAAVVNDDIKVSPGMKLSLPVCNSREGGDDEKGPFDADTMDLFQECDWLDGLSQAHLVSQDAVAPDGC